MSRGDFAGDEPTWRLRMVGDDDRTVSPVVVRWIKRPTTELRSMYPFIGPHDRVFVAKFPVLASDGMPLITDRSSQIKLQVAGVLGRGELTWRFNRRRPNPVEEAQ